MDVKQVGVRPVSSSIFYASTDIRASNSNRKSASNVGCTTKVPCLLNDVRCLSAKGSLWTRGGLFAFTPERAQVVKTAIAVILIHRANSADQRLLDRANADKS